LSSWYIGSGVDEQIVAHLNNDVLCTGETHSLWGKIYDFILTETDTVSVGARDLSESDVDPANDDAFSGFLESFAFDWTGTGSRAPQVLGADGTLTTTIQVEEITGVPAVRYPPAGP
jgi:hypothetical protein